MSASALIGWPRAGTRWALVAEAEWPATLPCPYCDGEGGGSVYRPTHREVLDRTDRDRWIECVECRASGRRDLFSLSDDHLLEQGYRWDCDGNLWRIST